MVSRAWLRLKNQCSLRHSSRRRPLKLSTYDEMQLDPVGVGPGVERPADELRAVVGDQLGRCPPRFDQALQHLGNTTATDRGIDVDREARTGEIVDHGEEAKAPAVIEHIEDEVERPALIDAGRRR